MFQTKSPFDLLHGTPPGLAVLPDHGTETTFERLAALKRAAVLAVLRSRRRTLTTQSKKTGGRKNG